MNNQIILKARRQLGLYLKSRRLEMGMNRAEAARRSGLTREQIIHIEAGTRNYTIDGLFRLLNVLDLYIYFADREGEHGEANLQGGKDQGLFRLS
jgi:transcriptional regulator with XRE-family HTH domain